MSKIRVLIVDDAVVIRRLVSDALSIDSDIEVVGAAANGRIALQKIPQCNPDVVTMDVEMPELDGVQTLREIRKTWPDLPVIMFSTLTERGAATTLDALAAGASDYVTKPANVGSVTAGLQRVREDLIPKIKGLAERARRPAGTPPPPVPPPLPKPPLRAPDPPLPQVKAKPGSIEVVAIGVSTGGPNALAVVLPQLPKDFRVPIVVVQHMPPMFTRLLAERLDAQCPLHVVEAQAGQILKPGEIYIAPGDYHMVLERRGMATFAIALNQAPPENSCRPAADVLFRSVAQHFGGHALGVVLTGMGQDGLRGCELIHDAGGPIVVQDEPSSVVWGMPGFVAKAGLADRVLPLRNIASELVRRVAGLPATQGFAARAS